MASAFSVEIFAHDMSSPSAVSSCAILWASPCSSAARDARGDHRACAENLCSSRRVTRAPSLDQRGDVRAPFHAVAYGAPDVGPAVFGHFAVRRGVAQDEVVQGYAVFARVQFCAEDFYPLRGERAR
jgi:hypothetical protein